MNSSVDVPVQQLLAGSHHLFAPNRPGPRACGMDQGTSLLRELMLGYHRQSCGHLSSFACVFPRLLLVQPQSTFPSLKENSLSLAVEYVLVQILWSFFRVGLQ